MLYLLGDLILYNRITVLDFAGLVIKFEHEM